MANKTSIEWTDYNWNFLRGCSRVSEGCRNCYAETVAARFSGPGQPYEGLARFVDHDARWTGEISFYEDVLLKPLRWTKPRKVFVNSMSDLFHEKVKDEWLDKAFAVMALTPQHTYQILTKRPERMRDYLLDVDMKRDAIIDHIWAISKDHREQDDVSGKVMMAFLNKTGLPNVWLGISCEDQKTADERIPILLQTPAAVRWISAEPLLGPIIFCEFCPRQHPTSFENGKRKYHPSGAGFGDPCGLEKLDWIVVGGESGPNARPMHPDWARSICDQCTAAGVPFFFKQWGEYTSILTSEDDWPDPDLWVCTDGRTTKDENFAVDDGGSWIAMFRFGKKKAGREIDGREWNEMPEVSSA